MRNLVRGLVLLNIGLLAGLFVRDAAAARNSSGTMSAINGPYTPGTTISSSIINSRFADIENELTDSLSRSAKGGMTSAFRGTDGAVNAPAFSFTNEAGSGWYRIGASDFGFAVVGAKQLELTGSLFTVTPATNIVGNFSVNTSKFTVASATGNVASTGQIVVDSAGSNSGTIGSNAVLFGSASGGEGIASKRTATGNQFGLDFYTNSVSRMQIGNTGTVTVSTPLVATGTLNVTGATTATGGLTVGASGTAIGASYSNAASGTLVGLTGVQCSNPITGTITVTGAVAGDPCIVGASTASTWTVGLSYPFCQVTSANTVTVQVCNVAGGTLSIPALTTFTVRVFH